MGPSLHRMAQRQRILTNTNVTRNNCDQRRRIPQRIRRRQMNRIQRADRFQREGPPHPGQNRVCDAHNVAPSRKTQQTPRRDPSL